MRKDAETKTETKADIDTKPNEVKHKMKTNEELKVLASLAQEQKTIAELKAKNAAEQKDPNLDDTIRAGIVGWLDEHGWVDTMESQQTLETGRAMFQITGEKSADIYTQAQVAAEYMRKLGYIAVVEQVSIALVQVEVLIKT